MPTKTTKPAAAKTTKPAAAAPEADVESAQPADAADDRYEIVGKTLVWHADVEEDETPFDVTLPLRLKSKALRDIRDLEMDDAGAMLEFLDMLVPEQVEAVGELDVNDMMDMVGTWFDQYKSQNGADPGEASGSSS